MAETRTTSQEVQAEILDAVRKGQEAVVDAIKHWAGTIQSIAPPVPVRNLPYADKLPKPEEVVATIKHWAARSSRSPRPFPSATCRTPASCPSPRKWWPAPTTSASTCWPSSARSRRACSRRSGR